MFGVVAVVQLLLHYVGWLGVVLGVIALFFGNFQRAFEQIVGGFGIIAVKTSSWLSPSWAYCV